MRLRLSTRAVVIPIALAALVAGGAVVANAAATWGGTEAPTLSAVPSSATSPTVPATPAAGSPATAPAGSPTTPTASPTATRTCRDASLVFCEDFDRLPRGGASSLRWGLDTRNATVSVAWAGRGGSARKRASQGLRIHTVDNGRAFLTVNDLALQGKPLYGRMRLKVQAFPTAPDWAHFTLVEATGSGSSEIIRPVGGQYAPTNGKTMWGIGADGGPTGDWTNWRESASTVAGTWQCVEWKLDPQGNQVQTWFDGVDNPDLTAGTNKHGGKDVPFALPAVNTVKIGWQLYQSGTTPKGFDLWLDDVALATTRIGC
jgi:hypothetical protein